MVSAKAELDEAALAGMADGLLVPASPGCAADTVEDAARIDAARFDEAPVSVRIRALYRLSLPLVDKRLPWRLVKAAASSARLSGRLASGCGMEFAREGRVVFARRFERASEGGSAGGGGCSAGTGFSFLAEYPGEFRIGKAGTCRIYSKDQAPGLRLDAFSWPLWIRSRRPGDVIRTGAGSKMLDSLMSEMTIPAGLRDSVTIVEDKDGIIAMIGSSSGGRDVYRKNDGLAVVPAPGFLVIEFVTDTEGATVTDAI
jgi:tRNA(Ile)-lysidine synthetase-like protein